jgi:two-component system sensor histidine kinase/response regulator
MKTLTTFFLLKGAPHSLGYSALALAFLASLIDKLENLTGYSSHKKLKETVEELNRKNALLNQLLAIVAHDVRAPLNSLKATLALKNKGKLKQPELKEALIAIDTQVDQLSYFLENIVRWVKNNSIEIEPRYEPILLHPLTTETLLLLQPHATAKQVHIELHIPESLVVFTDVEMSKLVLRNLINNAIKFCRPDDHIRIGATVNQGIVTVSVEDTGWGIRREDLANLFTPAHVSANGTRNEIGIGIGLSLCKVFVEKMGGKINVSSIERKGSRFEFTLHCPTHPTTQFRDFIELQDQSKSSMAIR